MQHRSPPSPHARPHPWLDVQPEVAAALALGQPVVALESTIISHGMPWPQNLDTALVVESEVRAAGAVPATIAVVDGRLKVGLAHAALENLARRGPSVAKASRRDLPILLAQQASGATTVAATMLIAAQAGIRLFATGGIGGVRRGAATSMDISADLQELARTPVAVVCAGIKSILDLGLTLEYLETHGVPVLGLGTDALPAFYSRDSGFAVDARVDTPEQAAGVLQAQWGLGYRSGLVLANPVPEVHAMPHDRIAVAIDQALAEAARQGVSGKATTPFLLQRVSALTGGQSLAANIALVRHNAQVAARVAVAYTAVMAQAQASAAATPSATGQSPAP